MHNSKAELSQWMSGVLWVRLDVRQRSVHGGQTILPKRMEGTTNVVKISANAADGAKDIPPPQMHVRPTFACNRRLVENSPNGYLPIYGQSIVYKSIGWQLIN